VAKTERKSYHVLPNKAIKQRKESKSDAYSLGEVHKKSTEKKSRKKPRRKGLAAVYPTKKQSEGRRGRNTQTKPLLARRLAELTKTRRTSVQTGGVTKDFEEWRDKRAPKVLSGEDPVKKTVPARRRSRVKKV